jgi:CheY-like chemotaxis protein
MAEILLIDDMAGVQSTVGKMLTRGGHRVTTADDGGKGIELLKSRRFDLVITDVLMPQVDGIEVLMFARTLPQRPPIVVISGGASGLPPERAVLLAKHDADAVLAKPFAGAELLAVVDRLLGGSGKAA